ncbi:MAG: glycosyltransferase 87 family protein [Pseudomonadota bacterium]|nr:glycosyltransferase 87 family protein [Pseudomonadota bacterium]
MTSDRIPPPRQRLLRSLVLLLCLGVLGWTGLRVAGQGFHPRDDALRHVAKVVSGKPWTEILVVRPEISMDSHPGWHALLGAVRSVTKADKQSLLNFSVLFLFFAFTMPPVFYLRRGEAWIAALALSAVVSFGPVCRLFFGRPYIASMILILLFCFLWERIEEKKRPGNELAALAVAAALAAWIHGTWYLFTLPLLALALARRWRALALVAGAVGVGVVVGAALTGSPLVFLHQMLFHALESLGKKDFAHQLVGEFQPFAGEAPALFLAGGLLLWRRARGAWEMRVVDNPVFYLAVVGWIMGFFTLRFWTDWGWPALAFWVAGEIQAVLEAYTDVFSIRRLFLAGVFCLVLLLATTNDRDSRWSGGAAVWPDMEKATHRPWLPEPGGILYNDNMDLFYQVFYQNPQGPWRYALGFEPIWMTAENLKAYRRMQLTRGKDESYRPWVEKMTKRDRMILIRHRKPEIAGLEWHEITPTVWSGKVSEVK